jgi:hypothetical protein
MSVSEFAVNVTAESGFVQGTPRGEYGREAYRMVDGDLFTFYKSERAPAIGEIITFHTNGIKFEKIVVMQSSLCGADVVITSKGREAVIGQLDAYYSCIPVPAGVEKVAFVWKQDVVQVINNVLFV